jgi:hypothetical protein
MVEATFSDDGHLHRLFRTTRRRRCGFDTAPRPSLMKHRVEVGGVREIYASQPENKLNLNEVNI